MYLTKDKLIGIIHYNNGYICEEVSMEENMFYNKYLPQIGKQFQLGDYIGVLIDAKYFPDYETDKKGLLIYRMPYKLEIVRSSDEWKSF